jgi:hypothetical protein
MGLHNPCLCKSVYSDNWYIFIGLQSMSTQILITKSGVFAITEYAVGAGKCQLQITDIVNIYNIMKTGYILGITKNDAKELGEAIIKWASI